MANMSIKAAFERMWQHTILITDNKANVDHVHDDEYDAKGAANTAEANANKYTDNKVDSYLLDIDYDSLLKFDTTEIVFDANATSTTSILGSAILGQMVLA